MNDIKTKLVGSDLTVDGNQLYIRKGLKMDLGGIPAVVSGVHRHKIIFEVPYDVYCNLGSPVEEDAPTTPIEGVPTGKTLSSGKDTDGEE